MPHCVCQLMCITPEKHLAQWIPALCAKIEEKAESDFYQRLAALTSEWIREDRKFLCNSNSQEEENEL